MKGTVNTISCDPPLLFPNYDPVPLKALSNQVWITNPLLMGKVTSCAYFASETMKYNQN